MTVVEPPAQLKADLKKIGDTMLDDWLKKAGPDGKALVDAVQQDVTEPVARFLDGLYTAAAWLAAACMIGVLVMVLRSIVDPPDRGARAGHRCLRRLPDGRRAVSSRLAHTLKRGEHIRVTLLVQRAAQAARAARIELWSLGVGGASCPGLFAWYASVSSGSRASSTTSRPATTQHRCGFRSSRWRSARACC